MVVIRPRSIPIVSFSTLATGARQLVVLEVRAEIDPCDRMEELQPGLRQALTPDWRGGAGAKVISGGTVSVGDEIRIEDS